MPRYVNNATVPIYYNGTVFVPNCEVETKDSLEVRANIISTIAQPYNIVATTNDTLYIRFNTETAWTVVTLTAGAAQTAANIASDINSAYGSTIASAEGGKIRIDSPIVSNTLTAIYIATAVMGSTAAATLGLTTDAVNPVECISSQAFVYSENAELYNITDANNTFIFRINENSSWITATLTTGVGRTAAQIAADINYAYSTATADANKIALAVIPVIIGGNVHIKLLAPVYNNFQSKIYIKSTGNTALTVLGFTGDNFNAISQSGFPSLIKTAELPLYNPVISETVLTFTAAATQYYYFTDSVRCKELSIIRASGTTFTCYIQDITNTPPFTIAAGEIFTINLASTIISRLVISSVGAGSLTIRELVG